jgi:hypothetical protein
LRVRGNEYEDGCLLGCGAVSGRSLPTFQMMEAGNTAGMAVNFYQITWQYNPEDSHLMLKFLCIRTATQDLLLVSSLAVFILRYI